MTDRYAVIGNPIAQSKSPQIHAAFAAAAGHTIGYARILGESGHFAAAVDRFRAEGGLGLNVTAPFKRDAAAYADALHQDAADAGAANCLHVEPGGRVTGYNFDGVGLLRDVEHNLGFPLRGRRVLLLGAGGATRGALRPFLAAGPAALTVANRNLAEAHALLAPFAGHPVRAVAYEALAGPYDIVLNATSASLAGELPPVPGAAFRGTALAYDLTYGKGLTPFLRAAGQGGVPRLVDGVGMLVEQAAEAFALWRGVRPDTAPAIRLITIPLV